MNALDYYNNPEILRAINFQIKFIKNKCDVEDCRQEIWSNLYDFMPLNTDDAVKLVNTVGVRFRRAANKEYVETAPYKDGIDFDILGDGNYQRKAHISPAD